MFLNRQRVKIQKRKKNIKISLLRVKLWENKRKRKRIVPRRLYIYSNKSRRKKKTHWLSMCRMVLLKRRRLKTNSRLKSEREMNRRWCKGMKKKTENSSRLLFRNQLKSSKILQKLIRKRLLATTKWFWMPSASIIFLIISNNSTRKILSCKCFTVKLLMANLFLSKETRQALISSLPRESVRS